jgi:hypothetical protein
MDAFKAIVKRYLARGIFLHQSDTEPLFQRHVRRGRW